MEAQHEELLSRVTEFEKGMKCMESELASTKTAFEEAQAKESETRVEFQRAVEAKEAFEAAHSE